MWLGIVTVCVFLCVCVCLYVCVTQMPAAKQKHVAEELERTPGEVLKKLEDVRNKIM